MALGSGGGGGSPQYPEFGSTYQVGAAGGSGIVILRMDTAVYSGVTTGSPAVSVDGAYTVLQFTSSGSYTS